MNFAPSKKRSPEKIDDMCALLMAIAPDPVEGASVYESRGLFAL
jgi:hypothetical protein